MIEIDLNWAISIILIIVLLLVFSVWIFYNFNEDKELENLTQIHICPFCTHVFKTIEKKDIQTCPSCKSLVTDEEKKYA